MAGSRVGVHQVERAAPGENGVGRRDLQQPAVFLVDHGFLDGKMSGKPAAHRRHAAIIEDRRAAVAPAEAFDLHPLFTEFLSEIEHERRGVEQQRHREGCQAATAAARDPVARQPLLVVVFQETEHPRLQVALELPFLRQRRSGPFTADDTAQGVIETGLVVEQVETGIGIFPVVLLAIDLRDEKQSGTVRAQRVEGPAEEFGRHELHHVATEAVHALVRPELQDLQHLAPGAAAPVVELDGVVPVVQGRPRVENVVAGGQGRLLDIVAVQRFRQMEGPVEQIEVVVGEIAPVFAVHVVRHEVEDDFHPRPVRTGDQRLELRHAVVEVHREGGIDVEPVSDGIGRAGLPLDQRRIAVGDGRERRPGGVGDHAGVPYGTDGKLPELQEHVVGDVVELARPVLRIRASGDTRPVPEGSKQQLINNHPIFPSSGSCRSRIPRGWGQTASPPRIPSA